MQLSRPGTHLRIGSSRPPTAMQREGPELGWDPKPDDDDLWVNGKEVAVSTSADHRPAPLFFARRPLRPSRGNVSRHPADRTQSGPLPDFPERGPDLRFHFVAGAGFESPRGPSSLCSSASAVVSGPTVRHCSDVLARTSDQRVIPQTGLGDQRPPGLCRTKLLRITVPRLLATGAEGVTGRGWAGCRRGSWCHPPAVGG